MSYKYFTTFWSDFSIAERFGTGAIEDTAMRAFEEWKSDTKYLTELVMVINHKCWDHYEQKHTELSRLYGDMYYEYYDKALDYLSANGGQEDVSYFIRTLD